MTLSLVAEPEKPLITASLKNNAERDLFILIFRHLVAEEAETSKLKEEAALHETATENPFNFEDACTVVPT
jgi:hypothetical protein